MVGSPDRQNPPHLEPGLLFCTLLALSQPAAALDVKWWGVGPTLGTVAVPATYPFSFPVNAKSDGDLLVQKVKGDIDFGVHGVLYPTGNGRIGVRGLVGLGLGSPWSSGQLTVEYDHAMIKEDGFQLLVGAGIGAGTERFGGVSSAPEGYLITNYFPLRAQLSALLRDRTRAYELSIFGAYHIAADQTYYAEKGADGLTVAEALALPGAPLVAGALYGKVGVEATVYFGDFQTDRAAGGDGGGQGGGRGGRRDR